MHSIGDALEADGDRNFYETSMLKNPNYKDRSHGAEYSVPNTAPASNLYEASVSTNPNYTERTEGNHYAMPGDFCCCCTDKLVMDFAKSTHRTMRFT